MVETAFSSITAVLDPVVAAMLVPLACWIILNAVDDILVDLMGFVAAARNRTYETHPPSSEEKRIAILVPCWQEHAVIGRMIQQNIDAIAYENYDIFIGTYPNDPATVDVVRSLAARFPRVHYAIGDRDGPTSKADCLNWTWRAAVRHETAAGVRYEIIVTHDAEDVIHPQSLRWLNHHAGRYAMIQVPVLPLATPVRQWTHGVYCDEFTEYQSRDMPAREIMGAFIPSNGVGTGYRRDVVDNFARSLENFFEPLCLTEDYENGYRLGIAGFRQRFIRLRGRDTMATREYFPMSFRTAVKQRTRWTTGIALQSWDRHGWRGPLVTRYWLWRDRKGLINTPCGLASNLFFLYGIVTAGASASLGVPWTAGAVLLENASILALTGTLGVYRVLYRMACVAGLYGWFFAAAVPIRMVYANLINSVATALALREFLLAKALGRPLRWLKTLHEYPAQIAFAQEFRRIGELLVTGGLLTPEQLEAALRTQPAGQRIGEHLVRTGIVGEHDIYEALCRQHGLPRKQLRSFDVPVAVARALPAEVARMCRVVPFRVEFSSLFLACTEVPTRQLCARLKRYTSLDLRFHLVTPSDFDRLIAELL